MVCKDLAVIVFFAEAVRNEDTGIRPSDASVHGIHVEICAAFRGYLRKFAVFGLPVIKIVDIFSRKCSVVKEV